MIALSILELSDQLVDHPCIFRERKLLALCLLPREVGLHKGLSLDERHKLGCLIGCRSPEFHNLSKVYPLSLRISLAFLFLRKLDYISDSLMNLLNLRIFFFLKVTIIDNSLSLFSGIYWAILFDIGYPLREGCSFVPAWWRNWLIEVYGHGTLLFKSVGVAADWKLLLLLDFIERTLFALIFVGVSSELVIIFDLLLTNEVFFILSLSWECFLYLVLPR